MSSEWQPPRTPLFGIALIPPQSGCAGSHEDRAASPAPPDGQPGSACPAPQPPPQHVCHAQSAGWSAVAISPTAPVAIAIVAEQETTLWPGKWLHPAERRALEPFAPPARRQALAVLTAARRALTRALSLPAPAAASIDLSPLLEGAQSVRVGDWTVQRVPAPRGCFVAVAAPGSGWGYSLLPPEAIPAPADA